ncbi:MAG TPA: glutathione S-transferase family protein [Myxococcales bacterium]|nr:glutathione S-transferase family protein [Myxococcales bacterium]
MAKMTLTYFDTPSSRGEECRLALFLAGVPFTDERLKGADWPKRKDSTPYGALPVLTAEGQPPIAQSNAILRLIGSQHGLHPADAWEAARHEALMGAIEDMRGRIGPTRHLPDAERKRAREELASGYLQEWGGHVQAQLGDPFVGGAAIQVADLKLFVAMTPLLRGSIDHVPGDVFKAFPKLLAHHEAVESHPKVVAWYAR